jgi:hypothetical protein
VTGHFVLVDGHNLALPPRRPEPPAPMPQDGRPAVSRAVTAAEARDDAAARLAIATALLSDFLAAYDASERPTFTVVAARAFMASERQRAADAETRLREIAALAGCVS